VQQKELNGVLKVLIDYTTVKEKNYIGTLYASCNFMNKGKKYPIGCVFF